MKKTNEKPREKINFTIKNIIIFMASIIILLYITIFYNYYLGKNSVFAKEIGINLEQIKISNAKKIDINQILENNKVENIKEEYVQEETELEYLTKYQNNSSLPKGTIQVIQEGREGKQTITKKITYKNGIIDSEEQIGAIVTKASVNKIVELGTANYSSNYKIKVGDTLYATSDRLSVMVEPSEEVQKIATLSKNDELKLLEINGEWYKIRKDSVIGYVKAESTTYINGNTNFDESSNGEKNRTQLIAQLSFDMQLNKPSGFTLEQFKKVLSDKKDVNKVFENNAEYFYYIEKQYNINGIFVASIGIHESAWGTSQIAKDKNNLFGYGSYDSNPYNGAYSFGDYSESIDLIARVLVKYYLNTKGTSIYGGEKAAGTYYNGATLTRS